MKKKIVFMIINMNVGGTEKALLNMINETPKHKYDITILMLEKYGDFLDLIPDDVHVEYIDGYSTIKDMLNKPPKEAVLNLFRKRRYLKGTIFMFIVLLSNVFHHKHFFFKYLLKDIPVIKNEYDIAVAYAGPMDLISYFIAKKVSARKKCQWIHFDVTKVGFDKTFSRRVYAGFDRFFVVSKEAKQKFIYLFPELTTKTEVFNNLISPDLIHFQSMTGRGFDDDFNGIRILTVGRLSFEKGQDMAIRVLAKLIQEGEQIKWYCVGDGSYRRECEQLIKDYNLQAHFILLGSDINPYVYMKQCDIYVQPSRYEGYCITLIESRSLGKPIVTTDVNGAREQIKDGVTGLIVDVDEYEIYTAVKKLIYNKPLSIKMSDNLLKEKVNVDADLNLLHGL